MDDLAHDLADALDVHVANVEPDNDGPSSTMNSPRQLRRQSRKRRGRKRRCDQNPLCDCGNLSSGSDSSYDGALKDYIENIKAQEMSDSASDEMAVVQRLASSLNVTSSTSNVYGESDSVTENYNIHKQPHRKKKRMRKMIIDSETSGLQNVPVQDYIPQTRKRRRKLRKTKKNDNNSVLNLEGRFGYKVGKKRNDKNIEGSVQNMREKNNGASTSECLVSEIDAIGGNKSNITDLVVPDHEDSMEDLGTPTSAGATEVESIQDSDVTMEAKDRDTEEFPVGSSHSSSSFSSSSSDDDNIVIFTNDEGREGDDEQSDFFHEPGGVYGIPGIVPWWEKPVQDYDPRFQNILEGSFPLMSIYSQSAFHDDVRQYENGSNSLRNRGSRRKGKIKKQKMPNSFLYSVNQKIIRFLKNQQEEELWFAPMKKKTRIQIGQLASLYNLDMKNEWTNKKSSLTLLKTSNTYLIDKESVDEFLLAVASSSTGKVKHYPPFLDPKRRRKTPPPSIPFQEGYVDRYSNPIPDSNIGSKMLQSMGWKPGTGLGADGSGITEPIRAFQRQKNKGLGYGSKLKQN